MAKKARKLTSQSSVNSAVKAICDIMRRSRSGAAPEPAVLHELLERGFGRSGQSVRLLGVGVRFAEESSEEETQLELPLGWTVR